MVRLQGARSAPVGAAVLTKLTVLTLLLSACTGGGSGAAGAGAGAADLGKATKALDQTSTDLRAVVNGLAQTASGGQQAPYGNCPANAGAAKTPFTCVGYDTAGPCDAAGNGQLWPQRWGYNVNVQLTGDAYKAGQAAVAALAKTPGWAERSGKIAKNTYIYEASGTIKGMSFRVVADQLPGLLSIEAFGPCVTVDGTLRGT